MPRPVLPEPYEAMASNMRRSFGSERSMPNALPMSSGRPLARDTWPTRCGGTDDPMVTAYRPSVAALGKLSTRRPAQPVVSDCGAPAHPCIHVPIELKCERSGGV